MDAGQVRKQGVEEFNRTIPKITGGVYRTVTPLHRQVGAGYTRAGSSHSAGSISTVGTRPNASPNSCQSQISCPSTVSHVTALERQRNLPTKQLLESLEVFIGQWSLCVSKLGHDHQPSNVAC
jgi:hypothetical protein